MKGLWRTWKEVDNKLATSERSGCVATKRWWRKAVFVFIRLEGSRVFKLKLVHRHFSVIFLKGNDFRSFLFAVLDDEILPEKDIILMDGWPLFRRETKIRWQNCFPWKCTCSTWPVFAPVIAFSFCLHSVQDPFFARSHAKAKDFHQTNCRETRQVWVEVSGCNTNFSLVHTCIHKNIRGPKKEKIRKKRKRKKLPLMHIYGDFKTFITAI